MLTNSQSGSLSMVGQRLNPRTFSNLPSPPEKKRDAKAESEARLYRMDEIDVHFDVKPGVYYIGRYEAEIR
jgi:hypothetical protein